jgi:hypothetical protein
MSKHMPDTQPCPYCGNHGPNLRVALKAVEEDSMAAATTKKIMSVIILGLAILGCAFIGERTAQWQHRADVAKADLEVIRARALNGDPVNP